MAEATALPNTAGMNIGKLSGPILILLVLVMLVVPLPPWAISFLFAVNICAGLVILGASLYIASPSEFSAFPSILLATTLMRLALNVATARAILLNGYSGPGAAGRVIESFGNYAVGGNYVVGGIIFVILIIINFVVVTKGASRVAEVSARFMLDSLPGRQLTIDTEANSGTITTEEAERRRSLLRRDTDFFGAMDGASKFVRGDVVAAMIILVVNMVGGLIIGTLQAGLPVADAARTYTLLTVGDGLAAQIPSLTISIAAGLVVTRVQTGEDIGSQIKSQISRYPQALLLTAALMFAIGLMPGMAHIPFLAIAGGVGFAGWNLSRPESKQNAQKLAKAKTDAKAPTSPKPRAMNNISDVTGVEPLTMNIGFALTPLAAIDGPNGILQRLTKRRDRYGAKMGFLLPPLKIHDARSFTANGYAFYIRGSRVGGGEVIRDQFLAIETADVTEKLDKGRRGQDPVSGQSAYWIDRRDVQKAEELFYDVKDETKVIADHFEAVLKLYGTELFGRPQLEALLAKLAEASPKLAEDLRSGLNLGTIRTVLTDLLAENVSIRDFERIAEALVEANDQGVKDPERLLSQVRLRMGRNIVSQVFGEETSIRVATLADALEDRVERSLKATKDGGAVLDIEPTTVRALIEAATEATKAMKAKKMKPAIVVQGAAKRRAIANYIGKAIPVLAYAEIPGTTPMQVVYVAGEQKTALAVTNG